MPATIASSVCVAFSHITAACEQEAVASLGGGMAEPPSPTAALTSTAGGKRAGRAAGGADACGEQAASSARGQPGEASGRDAQVRVAHPEALVCSTLQGCIAHHGRMQSYAETVPLHGCREAAAAGGRLRRWARPAAAAMAAPLTWRSCRGVLRRCCCKRRFIETERACRNCCCMLIAGNADEHEGLGNQPPNSYLCLVAGAACSQWRTHAARGCHRA